MICTTSRSLVFSSSMGEIMALPAKGATVMVSSPASISSMLNEIFDTIGVKFFVKGGVNNSPKVRMFLLKPPSITRIPR